MIKICIIDDEKNHAEKLKRLLGNVLPTLKSGEGNTRDFKIDCFNSAVDIEKIITSHSSDPDGFPYDVVIADVFMPQHAGSDREHPHGGAVRIYRAIKEADLSEHLVMLIVSKDIHGAEDEISSILREQRSLEAPWAYVYAKPGDLSEGPSEASANEEDWATEVSEVISKRHDQEWRKQSFLRAPQNDIVASHYFDKARMSIDARLTSGPMPFALITGEQGTGKEALARYIGRRNTGRDSFVAIQLRQGEENGIALSLFGREFPSPREGLLERDTCTTVFIDNFAMRSPARDLLDSKIKELITSVVADSSTAKWIAQFRRKDGAESKSFSGTIVFSCQSFDDLKRNHSIPGEIIDYLKAVEVKLPPLRERRRDIVPMAKHFLDYVGKGQRFDSSAESALMSYSWPNNLKELEDKITVIGRDAAHIYITGNDLESAGICKSGEFSAQYWKLKRAVIAKFSRAAEKLRAKRPIYLIIAGLVSLLTIWGSLFVQKLFEDDIAIAAKSVRDKGASLVKGQERPPESPDPAEVEADERGPKR